jgi:predicted RNase H-like HicB family nuclease
MTRIPKNEYSYTVVYEPVNDGFQITVPSLPGLITYGRDFAEAKTLAREAIRCHLEGLRQNADEIPTETSLVQERITVTV